MSATQPRVLIVGGGFGGADEDAFLAGYRSRLRQRVGDPVAQQALIDEARQKAADAGLRSQIVVGKLRAYQHAVNHGAEAGPRRFERQNPSYPR